VSIPLSFRRAVPDDFDELWPILHEVFESGESYPHPPGTTKEEGYRYWIETPTVSIVALLDNRIAGTYYLRPNQVGLGSHVANAGYMVASWARGKGVGRALCMHSISEAPVWGFKAIQFNLVVATNTAAVRLWQSCGFTIIGTIPKAFNHPRYGFVDAYIMHRFV